MVAAGEIRLAWLVGGEDAEIQKIQMARAVLVAQVDRSGTGCDRQDRLSHPLASIREAFRRNDAVGQLQLPCLLETAATIQIRWLVQPTREGIAK